MKARISHIHPTTNVGKVKRLDELHGVYWRYVKSCVEKLVADKRVSLAPSERRAYFPREGRLSRHILNACQKHAVHVMETWAKGVYGRELRSHIQEGGYPKEQQIQLYSIGKYALQKAGRFGKGVISQEMIDLYWGWVWDVELSGKTPQVTSRLPMWMSEMTCRFAKAKKAGFHGGWWLAFSSLVNGKRTEVPLTGTPYLSDPSQVAKSVMARRDGRGRWSFQFTDPRETPIPAGPWAVGVDVGLNCMAATSDGRLYGKDLKARFNGLHARIKDIRANRQRQGLKENSRRLQRLEDKLTGMVKTAAGQVANKLVKSFPRHTFVVEDLDLKGCRGQKRFAYTAVQRSLATKAPVIKVNPAYTSQQCPSCGHVAKNNRNGVKFHCRQCGRLGHADVVGGINLLRRSQDKQIDTKSSVRSVGELLRRRWLEARRGPQHQPRRSSARGVPSAGPMLTTGVLEKSKSGIASNFPKSPDKGF